MRIRVLAFAFLVLASACGREGGEAEPSATPGATLEATTSPEPTEPPAIASGPTAAPSTTAATAAGACRNSTSPSCGPLRFDPDPDDEPLVIRVSATPREPRVGQRVTFSVETSDADASRISLGTYEFSQTGPAVVARGAPARTCPRGYGPWDPPPKGAGAFNKVLQHTYTEAGTYEATFTATSLSTGKLPGDADGICVDPYASSGKADVIVKVR